MHIGKRLLCSLLMIGCLLPVLLSAQADSTILTYQEYLRQVIRDHPVAKQADLKIELAEAKWLSAKGNLDPELSSNWNQKEFDDKRYYRLFQGKLRVPTALGIDFVGGYENTEGVFLNPEDKTDTYGLWNLGIEANVLQGLLVNERRTALQQAKIFQDIAENQQQILLNELLYAASLAYLDWQKYFYFQTVIAENINLAQRYFENTRESFNSGEKTAMDTLEALIVFQDANTLWQANQSALVKAKQQLENYLWYEGLPLELTETTQPEDYEPAIFVITELSPVATLVANNPLILEKLNKQSYLQVAQKLKREKLKPKLKLKYNPLLSTSDNSLAPNYSLSDYKWGFDFSMPLLFRSERANVQRGEIKLQELQLDIENKRNELLNKVENSLQQQLILQEQMRLQQQNVVGYERLLEGENEKFRFGESSVFLLNKRQEKYIAGQLKLIELNIKGDMERLKYLYYTNGLR